MTEYHSTSLDLSIRIALGLEMMRPAQETRLGAGDRVGPTLQPLTDLVVPIGGPHQNGVGKGHEARPGWASG